MSSLFDQQWHEGRAPLYAIVSGGGGGSFTPGAVDGDLLPNADLTWSIGSGVARWINVYCNAVHSNAGTFSGSVTAAAFTTAGTITGADLTLSGTASAGTLSGTTLSVSGNATVTGSLTVGSLSVSSLTTGGISATGITASSLITSGAVSIGGSLTATAPTFAGIASFTNGASATNYFSAPKLIATTQVETPQIWSSDYVRAAVDVRPASNGVQSLGTAAASWLNLYANNVYSSAATITTLGATTANITTVNATTVTATQVGSSLVPSTNNTYNLGSVGSVWNTAYITTLNAGTLGVGATTLSGALTGTSAAFSGALTADTLGATGITISGTVATATLSASGTVSGLTGMFSSCGVTNNVAAGSLSSATTCIVTGNLSCGGVNSSLVPATTSTYALGSGTKYWTNIYTNAITTGTVQASTSLSTPTIQAISGNLALGSTLVPGGAVSLGVTGTRFPSAFVDALTVTNDTTTGTLSVTGETNINNKLWLGQAWESNYGLWARGNAGQATAIFKVEYGGLYGTTTLRNPNGTASFEIGNLNQVARLTADTFQVISDMNFNGTVLYSVSLSSSSSIYVSTNSSMSFAVSSATTATSTANWTRGTAPSYLDASLLTSGGAFKNNYGSKTIAVLCTLMAEFPYDPTGERMIGFTVVAPGPSILYCGVSKTAASSAGSTIMTTTAIVSLVPGASVAPVFTQSSGSTLLMTTSTNWQYAAI